MTPQPDAAPAEHRDLSPVDALVELAHGVDAACEALVRRVIDADLVGLSHDHALLEAMTVTARLQRRIEGLMTELTGEVDARATHRPGTAGIAASVGCRNVNDLLQAVTLASPQAIAASVQVARKLRAARSFTSGELLPPELPALHAALLDGAVGVDGIAGVLGPLRDLDVAVGGERMRVAEAHLAAAARGACCPAGIAAADGASGGERTCASPECSGEAPWPCGVRELRSLARELALRLDPDGAEPIEARALRKRGVSFGIPRDGLVPVSGNLLVDVAAQFQRISDAMNNPKLQGPRFQPIGAEHDAARARARAGAGAGANVDANTDIADNAADLRSRAQKQHDVLATILTVAARSGDLPTIGGATPTLVVAVSAADLESGHGHAVLDGIDEPLTVAAARHIGCGSVIQRVRIERGRIHGLSITGRVFDHWQRKAIVLRDGACVIPGCGVPAAWCEIHHVVDHAAGGPTHTDNGVLLCWWHHRALGGFDSWEVRMRHGAPEARPPTWRDASRRWRPVGTSRLHPQSARNTPSRT